MSKQLGEWSPVIALLAYRALKNKNAEPKRSTRTDNDLSIGFIIFCTIFSVIGLCAIGFLLWSVWWTIREEAYVFTGMLVVGMALATWHVRSH